MVELRLKLSFLLLLAWLFSPVALPGADELWLFQGDKIPVPPRQNQSWQPPETGIPAEYMEMVATAFQRGLADPRGCEYREVTIPMGDDSYGGFCRLKTHGWLLPRNDAQSQPFAILWTGLVYPVISVGDAASVRDDLQPLIAYHIQRNSGGERLQFPGLFSFNPFTHGTVCALLLRLGETESAETIYREAIEKRAGSSPMFKNDNIPIFVFWTQFSRALAAHLYGDDKLALRYAEQYEPLLEDETIGFAPTARELLADQRRRTRKQPVPKTEIDALLLELENVNARQYSQPGGVHLGTDERVKALIAVGDAAVEPLLKCLENDRRLTRAASYHRSFYPKRTIITVADAAYVALSGILQQSFFRAQSTSDNLSGRDLEYRREIAQQIRNHYNRYKNMSREEKWYQILQNDDEPAETQLQAAANICRESNIQVIPSSSAGFVTMRNPDAASVQLTGEILRSKNNPPVSELLNRRAMEYLPRNESAAASSRAFHGAQQMAVLSAKWDLPASLPILREVGDAIYRELPKYESFKAERLELLVPLTIQRAKAGDKAALRQYCETLLASPYLLGKNDNSAWEGHLRPLCTFPEEAIVIATAEAIFNAPGNGWSHYFENFKDARRIQDWLFVEFMRLAPYRTHVRNGLDDKSAIIKWETVISDNRVNSRYEYLDGGGSGMSTGPLDGIKDDPLPPGDQTTQILRVCDVYAKALSALKEGGYPNFQNYWNEKDRDRAIEKIAHLLSSR